MEQEKENREEELLKEEKSTLLEFYKLLPSLWNTPLKEYRDCDLRRVKVIWKSLIRNLVTNVQ